MLSHYGLYLVSDHPDHGLLLPLPFYLYYPYYSDCEVTKHAKHMLPNPVSHTHKHTLPQHSPAWAQQHISSWSRSSDPLLALCMTAKAQDKRFLSPPAYYHCVSSPVSNLTYHIPCDRFSSFLKYCHHLLFFFFLFFQPWKKYVFGFWGIVMSLNWAEKNADSKIVYLSQETSVPLVKLQLKQQIKLPEFKMTLNTFSK